MREDGYKMGIGIPWLYPTQPLCITSLSLPSHLSSSRQLMHMMCKHMVFNHIKTNKPRTKSLSSSGPDCAAAPEPAGGGGGGREIVRQPDGVPTDTVAVGAAGAAPGLDRADLDWGSWGWRWRDGWLDDDMLDDDLIHDHMVGACPLLRLAGTEVHQDRREGGCPFGSGLHDITPPVSPLSSPLGQARITAPAGTQPLPFRPATGRDEEGGILGALIKSWVSSCVVCSS